MTQNSPLQWLGGKAPGPQTADAGSCWHFTLPLLGAGTCRYTSDLFSRCPPEPGAGPLELILNIPPDMEPGVYPIVYSVEAELAVNGRFLLKILPPKGTDCQPVIQKPVFKPADTAPPEFVTQPAAASTNNIRGQGMPTVYRITVRRDDKTTPLLHRRIEEHQSLLVGKTSISGGILPDIDLTEHFATPEDARQCSRRQAKIYCMDTRMVIENLGKSDIKGPNGQVLKPGDSHVDWQPGQRFDLPGTSA